MPWEPVIQIHQQELVLFIMSVLVSLLLITTELFMVLENIGFMIVLEIPLKWNSEINFKITFQTLFELEILIVSSSIEEINKNCTTVPDSFNSPCFRCYITWQRTGEPRFNNFWISSKKKFWSFEWKIWPSKMRRRKKQFLLKN